MRCTGAGLGVLLAYKSLGLIVARLPERSFPNEADFHIHVPVLLFSVALGWSREYCLDSFPRFSLRAPKSAR